MILDESRTTELPPSIDNRRVIAYLLGELPEEEAERFEDECFALQDWPEQLSVVEEDLIEAYLRDELEPEQRQRFEQNYLTTPARQARVGVTSVLLRCVEERRADEPLTATPRRRGPTWHERFRTFLRSLGWWPRVAVAIVLAGVVIAVWWGVRPRQPQTILGLSLNASFSDRNRGVQGAAVKLGREVGALRVSLLLPEGARASRYRVELETDAGEVKPLDVAAQDVGAVSVVIPAAQLPPGAYALRLFARQPDGAEQRVPGNYFFTVE